jgi:hypothetical protein
VVSWVFAGLALLLALAALVSTRRLARRIDGLNQSYWELRYDYTRLRSQLSRLDPDPTARAGGASDEAPGAPPEGLPAVSFVPLSTIRKKEK